jgi:hypothetical protein
MKAPKKWNLSNIPCCYCELLWQDFPPVLFKLQLYQFESNIPSPSCTPTRSCTIHYTIFMYSLFENKRTIFTKFFLKSQNQPVNICLLWSDKTNWKCNRRVSTSVAKQKKLYPKNTMFCADFTKTIISRSLLLGEITRKYTACKKETTKEDEVNCL